MKPKGQVIVGAVLLLLVLMIVVPSLITYLQNESRWTTKELQNTRAFSLAEGAIERGYQQICQSTTTWNDVINGTIPAGFNFDQVYTDTGGTYEIRLNGVGTNQVEVTGIGKDSGGKEIRALRAVYTVGSIGNNAIYAVSSFSMAGNPNVEWGAVTSPGAITISGQDHPRFYSASSITPGYTNPNGSHTDNVQFFAYQSLGVAPQIDLNYYQQRAQAQSRYNTNANCSVSPTTGDSTAVWYCTGNLSLGPHNGYEGALIVLGNLSLNGAFGDAGPYTAAPIPSNAWENYGNDWTYYKTNFDPACPHATYADAVAAEYAPTGLTKNIGTAFMDGLLYIGGTLSINGGGNNSFYGVMYANTVANLGNSHVTFYYDSLVAQNVHVLNSTPIRTAWEDATGCTWASTHATCP